MIEAVERKLKRTTPGLIDDVQQRSNAISNTRYFIEYAIRTVASHAARVTDLAARTKTNPSRVRETIAELEREGLVRTVSPGLFMQRDTEAALGQRLTDAVEQFHREAPASVGISLFLLIVVLFEFLPAHSLREALE